MSDNGSPPIQAPPPRRKGPRPYILWPVVALCVLLPYCFWQGTWFGSQLSDREIAERLDLMPEGGASKVEDKSLRHAQHAIEQISQRMRLARAGRGESPSQFYPAIVKLAAHPKRVIRESVAWVMQEDAKEASFAAPLSQLLQDEAPTVRRNAALGLARRGDKSALGELRAMLESFTIRAEHSGKIEAMLTSGQSVRQGGEIYRVATADGKIEILRSPLLIGEVTMCYVAEGAKLTKGQKVCDIAPSEQEVYYALVALAILGDKSDVERVRAWIEPRSGYTHRVREQAKRTTKSLESRKQ